ncbi:hypothetical protein D9619_011319 [Psilocybe cf. subviscida]|uniref:Uncharacterized protein n=1 Tax=Psilocybe cf. subviscida TaxID=2480587 RepID=A0A8H5BJM1_9AGAR|nr:hypothetical protein D9619_011319 [Psilocybe cf. subviscida]
MGLAPYPLYSQSPLYDDDGQHSAAYCKSPSPVSSPMSRAGTVYVESEVENELIVVPLAAQAHSNALGEMGGKLPAARNQAEKYDLLSRSTSTYTRPGAQRSATVLTRQELFRPAGYTSAAPWLRSDQSQQPLPSDDSHSYPFLQRERERATTGSISDITGTRGQVVLELSRDGTIHLPNPYGHPPPSHNAKSYQTGALPHQVHEHSPEIWPTFSSSLCLSPNEHLFRGAPCLGASQQRQSPGTQLGPRHKE